MKTFVVFVSTVTVVCAIVGMASATSFRWDSWDSPDAYLQVDFNFDWAVGDPTMDISREHVQALTYYAPGGTMITLGDIVYFNADTYLLDEFGTILLANASDQPNGYTLEVPAWNMVLINNPIGDWSLLNHQGYRVDEPDVVPEPTTLVLLSAGLIGLVAFRRKYMR